MARLVDDYLAYYPDRTAAEIAAATNVPVSFVQHYVAGTTPTMAAREARADAPLCARCADAPATVGAHCNRCAIELRHEVREVVKATQEQAETERAEGGSRMHTASTRFRAVRYRYGQSGAGS